MTTQGYIGFTSKSVEHRFKKHIERSRDPNRKSKLTDAIKKHGHESMVIQTLLTGTEDYCLNAEKLLRPAPGIGWNTGVGGSKTTLGRKATPEQRAHFSKVHSGRKHTEEWKRDISERFKGKKFRLGGKMPEEAVARIADFHRGRKRSDETRKKMSESAKKRWARQDEK